MVSKLLAVAKYIEKKHLTKSSMEGTVELPWNFADEIASVLGLLANAPTHGTAENLWNFLDVDPGKVKQMTDQLEQHFAQTVGMPSLGQPAVSDQPAVLEEPQETP
jgi:hypothetical protein